MSGRTQAFLDTFGEALEKGDVEAVTEMFQDDCYWRDLVAFWNIKTPREKVRLPICYGDNWRVKPTDWKVAEDAN